MGWKPGEHSSREEFLDVIDYTVAGTSAMAAATVTVTAAAVAVP